MMSVFVVVVPSELATCSTPACSDSEILGHSLPAMGTSAFDPSVYDADKTNSQGSLYQSHNVEPLIQ
jgi:hypothetical protein